MNIVVRKKVSRVVLVSLIKMIFDDLLNMCGEIISGVVKINISSVNVIKGVVFLMNKVFFLWVESGSVKIVNISILLSEKSVVSWIVMKKFIIVVVSMEIIVGVNRIDVFGVMKNSSNFNVVN